MNNLYSASIIFIILASVFLLLAIILLIKTFFIDHFSFSILSINKSKKGKKKKEKEEMWDETVALEPDDEDLPTQTLDDDFDEEETAILQGKKRAKDFEVNKNIMITHEKKEETE